MTEKEIMELKRHTAKLTPAERERAHAELIRMLNSGEIELEDPALFFAQGL